MEHWTAKHITRNITNKEYEGWDESHIWIVKASLDRAEVVQALEEYAETLDRSPNAVERMEWEKAYFNEVR